MRQFNFIPTKENDLFVYKLYYDQFDNPIFDKCWDGLYENEPYEDEAKNPYYNFAINRSIGEDNIIYTTLIWRLLKDKSTFGIPNYYRDEAKDILKKDFEFIKWEYDIEYAYQMTEPKDNGFVEGRSCTPIRPEPTEWQRKHKHLAGLFTIDKYQDIIGLERATFGDATSEITFFGLSSDKSKLVRQLSTSEKPTLNNILNDHDIFIDLVIGHDMGYYNCVTIKSKNDITTTLNTLTKDLYNKGQDYEHNLPNIKTIDDFVTEMTKINGC